MMEGITPTKIHDYANPIRDDVTIAFDKQAMKKCPRNAHFVWPFDIFHGDGFSFHSCADMLGELAIHGSCLWGTGPCGLNLFDWVFGRIFSSPKVSTHDVEEEFRGIGMGRDRISDAAKITFDVGYRAVVAGSSSGE